MALVSKVLGHSSISITSDTYTHLLGGVGRAAAEASSLVPRARRDQSVTYPGIRRNKYGPRGAVYAGD